MKMDSLQSEKGKLHREKVELEKQLEVEQEYIVNRLQKRVDSLALEKERLNQEKVMLKREVNDLKAERRKLNLDKVILESTLEQEEEAIVNKLQRQIEHLQKEKRELERRIEHSGVCRDMK